jgi:hypothetical protein
MNEQSKEVRLRLITEWKQWVEKIINEERDEEIWIGYLMTFMFNHIPGNFDHRFSVMENEVERFYATVIRYIVRHSRSKVGRIKSPILVAFPNFPDEGSKGNSLPDVAINDGLHIHGPLLIPIETRLRVGLDVHIKEHYKHYVQVGRCLRRIDVRVIDRTPGQATGYALRSLEWKIPDTSRLIMLPKSLSEFPPKTNRSQD